MANRDNNTTLREQEQRGEQLLYEIAEKLSNKGRRLSAQTSIHGIHVKCIEKTN